MKLSNSSKGGLGNAIENKNDEKFLFITWGLMGLWHGANWTFLIWGLYHAVVIYIYRVLKPFVKNFKKRNIIFIGWFLTLPIIMLSWIPFRADSLKIALKMWLKVINPYNYRNLGLQENVYIITLVLTLSILITYFIKQKIIKFKISKNIIIMTLDTFMVSVLFYFVFVFLRPINQFIYFQF